jgi:PST family polysaccharide transporter
MSFARILRASTLMGGAQVVVLVAAFVRAKAVALILGASGVGLIGIFNAFSGNITSLAGWGLGTSGVRLIAGATEESRAAKVAAVRRMGWALSLLGLVLALALFWPAGKATFATSRYATEMAIVAFAVPCVIASSAWSAVLQATGKIASLAKVQIAGAITGLLLGLPAIYFWGTVGIAVSIFLAAAGPAIVLWRAARVAAPPSSLGQLELADIRQLTKLGGALMVVSWLGQLSSYLVRLTIVRHEGLDAAGYYQAAHAISGSLPGFVFAAMGADFFPRVAAAKDEAESRKITEKQIQAGLLLGVPLIMALLVLGKHGLRILYASSFDAAMPLLSWMTWGVFIRLITWPLGFWLLARGSSRVMIAIEGVAAVVSALAPAILIGRFGLISTSVAFAISNVIYGIAVVVMCRIQSGEWLGRDVHVWAAMSAAMLAAGQWWADSQTNEYAGLLPVVLAGMVCAWIYRHKMRLAD